MSITETDIINLKTDFYRFAELHSWYKHLYLEGSLFIFFKKSEQQERYCFDKCLTDDKRVEYWHFVESYHTKYLKELSDSGVIMYQAKFGPFLRGIDHDRVRGFHIIKKRNENLVEYLQNKYINFNETDQNVINNIATYEQTEYLNDVFQFNVYQFG